MPLTAWPTAAQVGARITAAGLTPPSDTARTDVFIAAAVDWWSRLTGYLPFQGTTQTRVFSPPGSSGGGTPYASARGGGSVLMLDNGLTTCTSLSINGTAMVLGTDYWLEPGNAVDESKPWEWIRFGFGVVGSPQSISIVGVWGYCPAADIPAMAWQSVLDVAAGAYAMPEIAQALIPSGVSEWSEGDASEKIGAPVAREFMAAFTAAQVAAGLYARRTNYVG